MSGSHSLSSPNRSGELPAGQIQSRLPTRVSKACERCRRHKSRCDEYRPCSVCQRAGVLCVPQAGDNHRPSKRQRRVQATSPAWSASQLGNGESPLQPRDSISSAENHHHEDGDIQELAEDAPDVENFVEPRLAAISVTASPTVDYREAESTIGFARKIFQLGSQSLERLTTSAIPDGEIPAEPSNSAQVSSLTPRIPIHSVLGCSLPPTAINLILLEEYFESVHWFSLVVYEPHFRAQFMSICDGLARPSQKPFLLLLSTVLGMAAWYYSKRPVKPDDNNADWSGWATRLIKHTESQLFEIIDGSTLANIQTCILLGSYNSYHGKPKAAFALLGATIKTAQAMDLHRESSRLGFGDSEERKRTWWTIYTWDRWASITYGRPLGISDKDCTVSMPNDVLENRKFIATPIEQEDELIRYSPYQRELNKVYQIASPMIEAIFGTRGSSNVAQQTSGSLYWNLMKTANWKLSEWRRSLPSHLVFDSDHDIASDATATLKAHRLQSLALQLTVDHLVIIFDRPLLAQQISGLSRGNLGPNLPLSQTSPSLASEHQFQHNPDQPASQELPNSEQWWSAAVRTSRVTLLPQIARLATDGHLVAFLAINLFNSALVMAVCALSDPLSDRAQEAKRNITRISRLQELLAKRSKLSMQSSVVLRKMVLMILQREAEAMLASIQPTREPSGDDQSDQAAKNLPYFSVEDALRLPLGVPSDQTTYSWHAAAQHDNNFYVPDETARLTESMASVQRVFQENEINPSRDGNGSEDNQFAQPYGLDDNSGLWQNNLSPYIMNAPGQRPFEIGGFGDELYWFWH